MYTTMYAVGWLRQLISSLTVQNPQSNVVASYETQAYVCRTTEWHDTHSCFALPLTAHLESHDETA